MTHNGFRNIIKSPFGIFLIAFVSTAFTLFALIICKADEELILLMKIALNWLALIILFGYAIATIRVYRDLCKEEDAELEESEV